MPALPVQATTKGGSAVASEANLDALPTLPSAAVAAQDAGADAAGIHVCFCTDSANLRPLLVAINSTVFSASRPELLVFHVITAPAKAETYERHLRAGLPSTVSLQVHHNAAVQDRIQALVHFRKSSGSRRGLASPLNFAPFYLDAFLGAASDVPRRLIYLDSDVVLRGDVGELAALDLGGRAAAAVEDCSQHLEIYIDFKELKKRNLLREGLDPQACVFNRGIFVMDVLRWRQLRVTEEIELWMARYKESKKDLYKFGMSQPPWLLALVGRYQRLGPEWNCRGLGRTDFDSKEFAIMKSHGLNMGTLKQLGVSTLSGRGRPFVAICAASAKLLHFNGPHKPWQDIIKTSKQAWCLQPEGAARQSGTKQAGNFAFVRCRDLWHERLSSTAARAAEAH